MLVQPSLQNQERASDFTDKRAGSCFDLGFLERHDRATISGAHHQQASRQNKGRNQPVRSPRYALGVVDTKQTKTIGEHHVASELARRGWAPALTRDGLERTDILAVSTQPGNRRMVEVQVKTAQSSPSRPVNWPLGSKAQQPSQHEREYFVLVAVPHELDLPPRSFVVPRSHVAAAAWIEHLNWLTAPDAELGKRNAPVDRARVKLQTFERYEDRWDLLFIDEHDAPVLLPPSYRDLAGKKRVGLPPGHAWCTELPEW